MHTRLMGSDHKPTGAGEPSQAESSVLASHDIRSQLTVVVGFSSRLKAAVVSGALAVDPQRAEEIVLLADAVDRLRDAIVATQDLASLERGTLTIDVEPFHLTRVVQAEINRVLAQHPELAITFQAPTDEVVESDQRLIVSIVRTLLRNAVKHAGPAGPINVALELSPAEGIQLTVRDHGQGVPAHLRPGLFQQQFEVDGKVRHRAGLGLHLAARLAERLGGQLSYEAVDPGASFTLTLPATHSESA